MNAIPFRTKEKYTEWTNSIWPGNPELGLKAIVKTFKHNSRTCPVWIFGNEKEGFSFVVAAGASSDYSYTGTTGKFNLIDASLFVDNLHKDKTLIK